MPDTFLHGIETVQIDDGIRPISTAKSSVIGFVGTAPDADATVYPVDTPVLVTGPRMAALLGDGGTLKDAYGAAYAQGVNAVVIVRVTEGADDSETQANVVGDETLQTGAWALLTAGNITGQTPRILGAPGFATPSDPATIAPVVSVLLSVAARQRAVVIADGPNTTEADAITYAGNFGDDRLYLVDPAVTVYDSNTAGYVTRPASGYVCGILSRMDNDKGFWWSPSNQILSGVTGTARPITFVISSTETEANRLNEAQVATIIRESGFRLWGNRSTSDDPLWVFLPVRRTADMIYESIEQGMLWAMDRPFSAQLLLDLRDSVQAYLDTLTARGAILGGTVWIDPELNTEVTLKAGKLYIDFDIEPPAPLEHLTFRAHREGSYYEELVSSVAAVQ
ncbi:MAG: phage tail sheath subtilisin-like domain-containing protein [Rhodobacteraceae bacterium]|nr:phage tail sheath subtilisin-like domain-containing protein [Paracoccaceae bacterium]